MNNLIQMVKKSILTMTIQAPRDIRWWRATAVQTGTMSQEGADGTSNKDVIVDKFMSTCLFACGGGRAMMEQAPRPFL